MYHHNDCVLYVAIFYHFICTSYRAIISIPYACDNNTFIIGIARSMHEQEQERSYIVANFNYSCIEICWLLDYEGQMVLQFS